MKYTFNWIDVFFLGVLFLSLSVTSDLRAQVPSPQILDITVDQGSYSPGDEVELTVAATNNGGNSDYGSISISFPALDTPGDEDYVTWVSNLSDNPGNRTYAPGDKINNKEGEIDAEYALFEFADDNWETGEINAVVLKIVIPEDAPTGDFEVYVRSNMGLNGQYYNAPEAGSYIDQQGWHVERRTVQVESLPGPSPEILTLLFEGGPYSPGDEVELTVAATNNGGNSDYGSISISFPALDTPGDEDYVTWVSNLSDNPGNRTYAPGDKINNKEGEIDAEYALFEFADDNWETGEINAVVLKIVIPEDAPTGDFEVYVRSNMGLNGQYYNAPEAGSYIDQQGWHVERRTVQVESLPGPSPEILTLLFEGGPYSPGDEVELTVAATNNGGNSDYGSISISFPALDTPGDEDYVTWVSNLSDNPGNRTYAPGDKINNKEGEIDAEYALFEFADDNWETGEINAVVLKIVIPEDAPTGDFEVYVRSNMGLNGQYYNAPEAGSYIDQQGWHVERRTVQVESLPGPSPEILTLLFEGGPYSPGDEVELTVAATNNGGNSDYGSISISFPALDTPGDEDYVTWVSNLSDNPGNRTYAPGDKINNKEGEIDAEYALFEFADDNWETGEINAVVLKIVIPEDAPTGDFEVYVRSNMGLNGQYYNAPEAGSYIDQQGWHVERRTVQVESQNLSRLVLQSINPATTQVKKTGEEVDYAIVVTDHENNPVSNVIISVSDELGFATHSIGPTDSYGQASYTAEIPHEISPGIYNITFEAFKDGYLSSDEVRRSIQVEEEDQPIGGSKGLTIITHGLSFPDLLTDLLPDNKHDDSLDEDQEWVLTMAKEIVDRLGGRVYRLESGMISEPTYSNGEGEAVLVFDWLEESPRPVFGYSEAAADALVSKLIEGAQRGLWTLDQLHFIGHSRGAIVLSEAIQRLGYLSEANLLPTDISVDPEVHFTPLDPHPWDDELGDGVGDLFSAEDGQVNGPLNSSVFCWSNIGFLDNYWHKAAILRDNKVIDLSGLSTISGCESSANIDGSGNNINLSDIDVDHGAVPSWYFGTIPFVFPGSSDIHVEDGWYDSFSPLRRTQDGYNYARSTGVTSPENHIKTDGNFIKPSFDASLYDWNTGLPHIFNGHFSLGAMTYEEWLDLEDRFINTKFLPAVDATEVLADLWSLGELLLGGFFDRPIWKWLPGWEQHSGESFAENEGQVYKDLNNRRLLLEGGQFRSHNAVYIPLGASSLSFDFRVLEPSSNADLIVYLSNNEVYRMSLNRRDVGYKTANVPIKEFEAQVHSITFSVEFFGIASDNPSVFIDNVQFGEERLVQIAATAQSEGSASKRTVQEGNIELHIYDAIGNHTGPTSDSTWVEEIPGTTFYREQGLSSNFTQFISLPDTMDLSTLRIEVISSEATSTIDVSLEIPIENGGYEVAIADSLVVSQGGVVMAEVQSSNEVVIEVDSDGDGSSDEQVSTDVIEEKTILTLAGEGGRIVPVDSTRFFSFSDTLRVNVGDTLSLEIVSDEGYEIASIRVDERDTTATRIEFIDVQQSHTVEATFVAITRSGISDEPRKQYVLNQNFPNPFRTLTSITYTLPVPSDIELVVFDLLGREVAVLESGYSPAGTFTVAFEEADLPSGVYLYRLRTDGFEEIKRMVVMN